MKWLDLQVLRISEVQADRSSRAVALDFAGYFVVWLAVQLQWAANPVRMNLLAVDSKWMVVRRRQPLSKLDWRRADCMPVDCRMCHRRRAVHRTIVAVVCRMFAVLVHTCWLTGRRKRWIEPMDPIHIYCVTLVQLNLRNTLPHSIIHERGGKQKEKMEETKGGYLEN